MKKLGVKINLQRNLVLSVFLLAGIAFSVVRIIFSAPPDPGHGWSDIGDNPGDALSAARGGTGQTSLTGGSVLIGNTTGAIKLTAPGTAGNILSSNGTAWASSALTGLVALIYTDEANSSEINTSTSETPLKSWVMNIDPAIYTYYILEAEVMANQGHDVNRNVGFTWNFKEGANLLRTFNAITIGSAITGIDAGLRTAQTIQTLIDNSLPASANLILNGQMNNSNAGVTMMAHSFRVYGVK